MKVGITIDLSVPFWANGLQQNIVFLNDLLGRIPGVDPLYITNNKPAHTLSKRHKGILLSDLLKDDSSVIDRLIVVGFDLLPDMYDSLRRRNPNFEVILIHYGNKLFDDLQSSIFPPSRSRIPLVTPKYLSQIWISPHHSFALEYLKTYYNFEQIYVAPYIWEPFFVQESIKSLEKDGLSPFFDVNKASSVCIFEPNKSHIKHALLPIMICQRLEQLYPGTLKQMHVSCCERLRKNHYFEKLMNRLPLVGKNSKKCFFNNRWSSLKALSKWGSTIVSNQINNELNYAYLEALHLGLPLIHNSEPLSDVGYYYPSFNIHAGAQALKNAIENHVNELEWYKGHSQSFLRKYSPFNESNITGYHNLIFPQK